jgi:hypothetical protein
MPVPVVGLTNDNGKYVVPFPTGKLYVEPETKLAGKVKITGPLIKEVADPPEIEVVAVFVIDNELVVEVANKPVLRLRIPETEVGLVSVTVLLPEVPVFEIVRLLNVVELLPPKDWEAAPLKVTFAVVRENAALFVQFPPTVKSKLLEFNVPCEISKFPLMAVAAENETVVGLFMVRFAGIF